MTQKNKMRLSGHSIARNGSFEISTKTNHNYTYNRIITLFLVHKSCCGNRRTCERNILC